MITWDFYKVCPADGHCTEASNWHKLLTSNAHNQNFIHFSTVFRRCWLFIIIEIDELIRGWNLFWFYLWTVTRTFREFSPRQCIPCEGRRPTDCVLIESALIMEHLLNWPGLTLVHHFYTVQRRETIRQGVLKWRAKYFCVTLIQCISFWIS